MKIGVPKETAANERRVALVPDTAGRLVKTGFEVLVEQGAGAAAAFPDDAYRAAGAGLVATPADVFGRSDVVLKVQPPSTARSGCAGRGRRSSRCSSRRRSATSWPRSRRAR